ncbi:MAG TPA: EamA family transporter [Bryobacteraceae bacterium]
MNRHPDRLAYFALGAVCLLWGITYLGIRVALEGLPVLYLIGIRYVISGSLLVTAAAIGGARLPRGRALLQTAVCGIIGIGIGNSFLALAELFIPSGLAALFYTTAPFWMVGVDALLPHGKKPFATTLGGLFVGLLGVLFLIYPAAVHEGFSGRTVSGFLLIQLSVGGWVLGALLQKRIRTPALPFVSGGLQQLSAGLAMLVPAALFEKLPHTLGVRPVIAIAYLVLFGSVVGYSSFIYALSRLPVAIVSIYTFVNPVVAVFLGWLAFREPFGYRSAIAMLIIFAGIGLVQWSEASRERARKTIVCPT